MFQRNGESLVGGGMLEKSMNREHLVEQMLKRKHKKIL